MYLKENKKCCHYTLPAIQNEIISILAQIMRGDIINEIKEAGIFSMMLDETSDVSKDEQLSFVFHYALWGEIFETFQNLRELGADGAPNMTGKYQGLKTRILQANPIVKSVHLNLALVQSCQSSIPIKMFFATLGACL